MPLNSGATQAERLADTHRRRLAAARAALTAQARAGGAGRRGGSGQVKEHQRSLVAARARRLERSAIIKAAECGMVRRQVTATIQRPTDPLVRPGATKTSN